MEPVSRFSASERGKHTKTIWNSFILVVCAPSFLSERNVCVCYDERHPIILSYEKDTGSFGKFSIFWTFHFFLGMTQTLQELIIVFIIIISA